MMRTRQSFPRSPSWASGRERVLRVPTDAQGAIRADAFAEVLGGVKGPVIVILQAGQINTGAFDPFMEIIPRP